MTKITPLIYGLSSLELYLIGLSSIKHEASHVHTSALLAEDIMVTLGDRESVFLVGDLNMWLGRFTSNIIVNIRSNIRNTHHNLEPIWVRP